MFVEEIPLPVDKAQQNERLRRTINRIKDNPQHWDQRFWHCKTSHCFAGFAQLEARGLALDFVDPLTHKCAESGDWYTLFLIDENGLQSGTASTWIDAARWFGLTEEEEDRLFVSSNTLKELEDIVNELCLESEKYGKL